MKTSAKLACAAAIAVACGGGTRQQPIGTTTMTSAAPAEWDGQAAASLRSDVARLIVDLDGGNFGAIVAKLDDDVILFDLDANDRPIRADGLAGARRYYETLEDARRTQDLRTKTTLLRTDCLATTTVGHCAVELDQTIHLGGRTTGPSRYRATFVARRRGPDWRFTHVHASLAAIPRSP